MPKPIVVQLVVSAAGIALIVVVLAISISRQTLYSPSSDDLAARRNISVRQRLEEMSVWPPIPDTPLYPLRMVGDRVRLFTVSKEGRPFLDLELASDRLESSKTLLAHRRSTLALTTLTKSTKYVLAAASDMNAVSGKSSSPQRARIAEAIVAQINTLVLLKQSFSDEQKAILDRLILELNAQHDQFL